MFYIYQITLLLVLLLSISSKIRRKRYRITFSIAASLFSTLEIAAAYMTKRFIDYRFYTHMSIDAIEGHGFQFVSYFIAFVGLFILLSIAFYYLSKKLSTSTLRHNKYFLPITLSSFILLSFSNGIFNEAYKIYEILGAEEKGFEQALSDAGIDPKQYIAPNKLTAKKGKNIIVISIESLEQGFFGKNTPNLNKLSAEWTFYNHMSVSPGAGWTAGSLYSHQVGMPAFFKGHGNSYFQGTTNVKLTGLGHILKKAGYSTRYLIGNPDFAGISDLLKAYGIPIVSEKNSFGKYPKFHLGLQDLDIFREAKLQVDDLKKQNKPFALFLSTINTHFPSGIYDKRMKEFVSEKENAMDFSISAVDYLIKDFIDYLKKNNLLENTVVYIFPDHLFMGSSGEIIERLEQSKRQLYLITNAKEDKLPKNSSEVLYQIDLPRMIIGGSGIQTNATFLTDYIKTKDIIEFLTNKRVELTTLNAASVAKKSYQNAIKIQITDNNLSISSDEDELVIRLDGETNISITSSEYTTSKKTKSIITVGKKIFKFYRGMNILTLDENDQFVIENFDTYSSQEAVNKFLEKIESLIENEKFWIIAMHDATRNDYPGFKEKLKELHFNQLQKVNGRFAYIAYSDKNNRIKEFSSKTTLTKNIKMWRDETYDISFNPEMVKLDNMKTKMEYAFLLDTFDKIDLRLHLIINIKDGKIDMTYLGDKQTVGAYKKGNGDNQVIYNADEIHLIMDSCKTAVELREENRI